MRQLRSYTTIFAAMLLGGCMMQNQSAPPEAGPSSFGFALTMTAVPDRLPRDGSSQATIHMNFRDGQTNAPLTQRRIILSTTAGTLSVGEVVTDASGNAAVTLTAPSLNTPVSSVSVSAAPVGNNVDNSVVQFVRVGMLGPDVPEASFTYNPVPVTVGEAATFDASGTKLNGVNCGGACSYTWDFGDGTSGTGILIQHTFTSTGVQTVTLTVGGPGGTSGSTSQSFVVSAPAPPVASFSVTPASPTAGANAVFSAAGSTVGVGVTITRYVWDFGDPNAPAIVTTTGPSAGHNYSVAGTYIVTLTITDSLGRTASVTQTVTVT
jgi:PKD repeat protein